jgi:protein ImuA
MATGAVARDVVCALRHKIAKIEGRLAERLEDAEEPAVKGMATVPAGRSRALLLGVDRFDAALGGGLPAEGLLEIHAAAVRDAGAAVGFALALCRLLPEPDASAPLLWIGTSEIFREAGRPYAPGLAVRFGLAADSLLIAEAEKLADVLWIAEEAAGLDAFRAILLEVRGSSPRLDLTATRRLHSRALIAGHPLFLLRAAGEAEPTAAPARLLVAPAPAGSRITLAGPLAGSIGPPAFHVAISKSRTAIPATFTLEWNDNAFQERRKRPAKDTGAMVPSSAGRPAAEAAPWEVVAFQEPQSDAAAGLQPARTQHAARRRAGYAR